MKFRAKRRRRAGRRRLVRRRSAGTAGSARPDPDIAIRPYLSGDENALFEAASESVRRIHRFLPWCRPGYTFAEAAAWVERQVAAFPAGTEYDFVIVSPSGRFLGACGLNQLDTVNRRANLGYWVRTSAMRRGVATAAVRRVVEWAFANTDLGRLEIVVSTRNAASLKVAEKAGATREGVLRRRLVLHGRPHDAVMFSFVRPRASERRRRSPRAPS